MVGKYINFFSKRKLIFILIGLCLLQAGLSRYLDRSGRISPGQFYYLPRIERFSQAGRNLKTLWADIFYIKGIMGFSDPFPDKPGRLEYIQNNMAAAISFDPDLREAYFFAACAWVYDKYSLVKGIEFLLKYGYLAPDDWRIPYWTGFNYYQMGEYFKAASYYQAALRFNNAPGFLRTNLPMLYYRGGRAREGLAYLEGLGASTGNRRDFPGMENKIRWLKNIILLEQEAAVFKTKTGREIKSLEELKNSGLIKDIPEDTFGQGFYWDHTAGRVKSRFSFD
jgi:tetratricopeptide (TPR) repeat protein